MNEQDFLKEAASIFPYLQEMRRGFHHHPELGDHEKWTSERIAQELTSMGIEVSRPVGTAVVGLAAGRAPRTGGRTSGGYGRPAYHRAHRSPFSSEISGVMHACGHDLHITAALGAARQLAAHRDALPGSVKLFFQPNEEGTGGAERMIQAGCMEEPHVDVVFGGHVNPELPVGTVGHPLRQRLRRLQSFSYHAHRRIYPRRTAGCRA